MPILVIHKLPGLEPGVFLFPLLTMVALSLIFGFFFARNPNAVPVAEPDEYDEEKGIEESRDETRSDTKPVLPSFWTVHYDRVVPAIIAAIFYLFALWHLGTPRKQVFDEVHHVRTAMDFLWGQDPHEWTHPHISKLLQAESMNLAHEYFNPADKVWSPDEVFNQRIVIAWRLPSVIFGTLALLGQYALTRALFKNRAVATVAMILLAMDGVFFVQSRIAMTNIFTVCFILWASWAVWRWVEEQKARHIYAAGLFIGLAIATRWSSLYAYALLILFLLIDAVRRWQKAKFASTFFFRRAGLFISALVLLPLVVYAASYIPYVLQGTDGSPAQKLLSWNFNNHNHSWGKVVSLQGDMYTYHSTLDVEHNYASPAWSWPFMLRPVWYFYESQNDGGAVMAKCIWCIGNAFIWWSMLPVLFTATWLAARRRSAALGFVCLLGMGQWFAWLAKARGLNFMHYLFESIPFVVIGLAYFLVTLWQGQNARTLSGDTVRYEPINSAWWSNLAAAYIVAVICWFVFYYPVLSATPIPTKYLEMHFWLGRIWI